MKTFFYFYISIRARIQLSIFRTQNLKNYPQIFNSQKITSAHTLAKFFCKNRSVAF